MASASSSASEEGGSSAEEHKAVGNAHYKAGEFSAAIDSYSAAIELDGKQPSYWCNRSAARMMVGKFREAAADCDRAIELDSKYLKAYMRGATARLRMVSRLPGTRSH